MLDERLTLAAALYEPCQLGADIGTDHAYLPCHLLRTGICQRMIASDVSEGALKNAHANLARVGLLDRASIILADGLEALKDIPEHCGCISLMGMGGKTLSEILLRGQQYLHGAAIVLSAHTEQQLVRQAIAAIGYRITREELCRAAGRFYVFWQAKPAVSHSVLPSEKAILFGDLLWQSGHPELRAYAAWRMRVAQDRLRGLRSAVQPDKASLAEVEQEIAFYQRIQEELPC